MMMAVDDEEVHYEVTLRNQPPSCMSFEEVMQLPLGSVSIIHKRYFIRNEHGAAKFPSRLQLGIKDWLTLYTEEVPTPANLYIINYTVMAKQYGANAMTPNDVAICERFNGGFRT
jgi:hypothetical protein